MRNKYSILFLSVFFLCLSAYKITFTYLDYKVQQKATTSATDDKGNVDLKKKQEYLDNVWDGEAIKIFNKPISYKKIKSNALNFGLDLQGGMSFIVEVDIDQLIISLAKRKYQHQLLGILKNITDDKKNNPKGFVDEIENRFKNGDLSFSFLDAFENKNNGLSLENSKNEDVKKYLIEKINSSLDKTLTVVKNRIDKNGTIQPLINKINGSRKIQIEVPGVNNDRQIEEMLMNVGALCFWLDYDNDTYAAVIDALNKILDKKNILNSKNQKLKLEKDLVFHKDDLPIIKSFLGIEEAQMLLPENIFICIKELKDEDKQDTSSADKIKLLFLQTDTDGNGIINGDVITDARPTIDDRGQQAISIKMNALGTKLWANITGENIGRTVVITLDNNEIMSAKIHTKISHGETLISGNFNRQQVTNISSILKSGSLPTPIHIIAKNIVGPDLGKVAQRQGLLAILVAFCLLILLLVSIYHKSGLVASTALLLNVIFILGGLSVIHTTLTLTGIAGLILTLGMAIDANILINERIKEELKAGKDIKTAIIIGYKKAKSAIIDSNVTSFLTGVVLFVFGSGSVKGFAITLMVGLCFSFFTAVYLSRFILYLHERRRKLKDMRFGFSVTNNLFGNTNINFVAIRKFSYVFYIILILCGVGCFFKTGGLKLGVCFTGGYNTTVKIDTKADIQQLNKVLEEALQSKVIVKNYGQDNIFNVSIPFAKELNEQNITTKLSDIFSKHYGQDKFKIISLERIEPSMAKDFIDSAKKSILVVLFLLFVYILFRFKHWRYGIATIFVLALDIIVLFSICFISSSMNYIIEFNQIFIAALLTVVGYSINNSVIIFDRIREKRFLYKTSLPDDLLLDNSINETLSRTIITSLSTIMVVGIIFLFGGAALTEFSFVVLVGLLVGTYSSIFISAPILKDLRN